jgi:hypothetical protein
MEPVTNLPLQKALRSMTDEELRYALNEAREEAIACEDEDDWQLIRDTTLAIAEELERRTV